MKCPDLDHKGLVAGSYSGPTHAIGQYVLGEALAPYGVGYDRLIQTQEPHVPAHTMKGWHSDDPEFAKSGTYRVTAAELPFQVPDGLVSGKVRGELAQKEPVKPNGSVGWQEYFDVSGCGPLVTAACAFVVKSVPWLDVALGGRLQVSTKYSGRNVPEARLAASSTAMLPPAWQVAEPFGESVMLRLHPDRTAAEYAGHADTYYSGGLYLSGNMANLAETATAQTVALAHILEDRDRAERTVTHAYGGSLDALEEAWARAREAATPTEAAERAYDILTR